MDRRDWYFKQAVSELELNGAFDAVEQALWNFIVDMGLWGIASGMLGSQNSPVPNLAVTVSGPGYAFDQAGERIFVPASTPAVNVWQDSNLVPTAVSTAGNEKWVSVFVKFARSLSDPRVDGNSNTIQFQSNESFTFVVVQGAEAPIGGAARPTKDTTMLLLFDVHLIHGQAAVLNADIDQTSPTSRRDDSFVLAQTPIALRAGNVQSAIAAMLQALNNHVLGVAGTHPDTAISSATRTGSPYALGSGAVSDQLTALLAVLNGPITAALLAHQQAINTVQFRPAYALTPTSPPWVRRSGVAWDPIKLGWIVVGEPTGIAPGAVQMATGRGADPSGWHFSAVYGGGARSGDFFTTGACRGIEPGVSPPNKFVYASGVWVDQAYVYVFDTNANTVAVVPLTENTNVTDVQVISTSGDIIIAIGSSSSACSHILHTTDQGATTPLRVAAALPVPYWLVAQTVIGGGTVLVVPGNPGGSQSGAGGLDVYLGTSGSTLTRTNVPGVVGSSETPVTLVWAADTSGVGCWLMTTSNAGVLALYRSYNGTTWTAVTSNLSSLNVALSDMAAIGALLIAVVNETPQARLLYSTDAGATWQVCSNDLTNGALGACRLASGANGFFAASDLYVLPSFTYSTPPHFGVS